MSSHTIIGSLLPNAAWRDHVHAIILDRGVRERTEPGMLHTRPRAAYDHHSEMHTGFMNLQVSFGSFCLIIAS